MKKLLLALLLPLLAFAQTNTGGGGAGGAQPFAGVPSGTCSSTQIAVDTTTGSFYTCNAGSWQLVAGGGASSWGGIGGTLSNQTDLQNALDAKVPITQTVAGKPLNAPVTLACADLSNGGTACPLASDSSLASNDNNHVPTSAAVITGLAAKLATTATFAGDVSGTYGANSVDKVKGVNVTWTSPAQGQKQVFSDASHIVNADPGIPADARTTATETLNCVPSGASATILKATTFSFATAIAVTVPQIGAGSPAQWPAGCAKWVKNIGAGAATLTISTAGKFILGDTTGSSTLVLPGASGASALLISDGTNIYVNNASPGITATGLLPDAALGNTAVTPASYTSANITVDAHGRVTAASNGSGSGVGTLFSVGFQANTVTTGTTTYLPVSGFSTGGTTEFSFSSVVGAACTAKNASVVTNSSNGVGTLTITLRNAATFGAMGPTALVVTIGSGAAAGEFHDTTHTVSIAAGSIIDWQLVMSANTSAQIIGIGFQCN